MKYFTRIIQNEILIEVQIAVNSHPSAGFISACKRVVGLDGAMLPPAVVHFRVLFPGDLSPNAVDELQRWLSEAAKMARLLDIKVTDPADFGATYEVRQVAGTLILDKRER